MGLIHIEADKVKGKKVIVQVVMNEESIITTFDDGTYTHIFIGAASYYDENDVYKTSDEYAFNLDDIVRNTIIEDGKIVRFIDDYKVLVDIGIVTEQEILEQYKKTQIVEKEKKLKELELKLIKKKDQIAYSKYVIIDDVPVLINDKFLEKFSLPFTFVVQTTEKWNTKLPFFFETKQFYKWESLNSDKVGFGSLTAENNEMYDLPTDEQIKIYFFNDVEDGEVYYRSWNNSIKLLEIIHWGNIRYKYLYNALINTNIKIPLIDGHKS